MPDQYLFTYEKLAFLRTKQVYDPAEGTWTRTDGRNRQRRKTTGSLKYKMINVDGVLYFAHILAYWFMTNGPIPEGYEVDHKDRDGWNCKWDNLRLVTSSGNKHNRRQYVTNTSGYRGVNKLVNGKYNATLKVDNKFVYLGTHATFEQAKAARIAAEIEHFGKSLDELHADLRSEGAGQPESTQES